VGGFKQARPRDKTDRVTHLTSLPPRADWLVPPLRRLLRPLVRLLIRCGIPFPVLADVLRGVYVQAASDLIADPKGRTDSRLSLMTGIHRKEIRNLREAPPAEEGEAHIVTRSSHIIARWLAAREFTDASGQPLPLPRTQPGGMPSFDALVASVTTDMRPRTVLSDWLDQGIVFLDADGLVRLNQEAFVPQPGREQQLFYFGRNLHDHIAAASGNVLADGRAPFFDRSVHYDGLSTENAARLDRLAREGAQALLVEINRQALAMVEAQEAAAPQPHPPQTETHRVNLGIFLYREPAP